VAQVPHMLLLRLDKGFQQSNGYSACFGMVITFQLGDNFPLPLD
jgi:hypothetical protein